MDGNAGSIPAGGFESVSTKTRETLRADSSKGPDMQGDSGLVISERHLRVSSPGWSFGGFVLARRSGRKSTGMDSVVFLPQFRKGRSGDNHAWPAFIRRMVELMRAIAHRGSNPRRRVSGSHAWPGRRFASAPDSLSGVSNPQHGGHNNVAIGCHTKARRTNHD
jgi:hypothetical protein